MGVKYVLKMANGTYTDKNGKEQTSWLQFGKVLEKKNGGLSLKIDSIPVAWDGWGQLFDPPTEHPSDNKPAKKSSEEYPF